MVNEFVSKLEESEPNQMAFEKIAVLNFLWFVTCTGKYMKQEITSSL